MIGQSDRPKFPKRTRPEAASLPRVLVVDDDTDAAEALVDILGHNGYEAAAVHNGIEALGHLKDERLPDVMIVDLFMPQMTGWDLIRELKRNGDLARIPIIVVSAFAYTAAVTADAMLSKPLDMETLLNTMLTLVTKDTRGN